MSYGHADDIARQPHENAEGGAANPWSTRPEARKALAARDIGTAYRLLKRDGVSQREIARRTGQSQSEVSEILAGRRVKQVDVLERICDGLGLPRELMGLSYGPNGAYPEGVTVTEPFEGMSAEMLRRHLLALGAIAAVGGPAVGELLAELGDPSPVPLPSRLSQVHVAAVRDMTRRLGEAGRAHGSDPAVCSAVAAQADRLLGVPGAEPVTRPLMVAVAELHIEAGWGAFDAGLYDRATHHYAAALELATEAGDTYCQALALNYAGLATVEHGHPNDGLKILQLGQVKMWDIPPDERRTVVGQGSRAALEACGRADSATALACLDCWDAADTELGKSRERWQPTRTDPGGDLDRPAALLELARGRLDAAESLAAASVRRWEIGSQRGRTHSGVVLATIHVRAGEPGGLRLAHGAITAVTKLRSVRARERLVPLAAALEARPSADAKELARHARQVAATRA
jgi:transcriptional regulator with XRE-family HTH domain